MRVVLISLIALLAIAFLTANNIKIRREQKLLIRQMDSTEAKFAELQTENAKIERALKCKDYAVCTALKRNIQYHPAIVSAWMQYLGVSRFGYNYVPDSLLESNCPCDSLKNLYYADLPE